MSDTKPKHILLKSYKTLLIFNKAKAKFLGKNLNLHSLSDEVFLCEILKEYVGEE